MNEKRKKKKEKCGAEKRGFFLFSLFTFLCVPLAACKADLLPAPREIENMALMRTMGVDALTEGGVSVTVSGGVRPRGMNEGREPPPVLAQKAGTISGACLALQSRGDAYLFFGHVGQLLLGEDRAARGVTEALEYVERDIEMRLDTEVYVVRGGTAGEAIVATSAGTAATSDRLEALERDGERMADTMPRTVKDVLAGLAQNGASFCPAVTLVGGELTPAGYALLKEGVLVGWAEGDAARGVNLLLGETDADVLELSATSGEPVALRLVGAKTKVRPLFSGHALVGLAVDCTVEANVAQAPVGLDLAHGEELGRLRGALAAVTEGRVRQAIGLAQGLDGDFLGLGKRAGLAAPWHWAAIQGQWGARFATLPVSVRVSANIQRGYDVKG